MIILTSTLYFRRRYSGHGKLVGYIVLPEIS